MDEIRDEPHCLNDTMDEMARDLSLIEGHMNMIARALNGIVREMRSRQEG